MPDDYSADLQTTGAVAVGGSATGTIETAYDQDWFAVELVAGRTYRFDLQGSPGGGGTLPDTYFRAIYNSEGRYQSGSYNDDFAGQPRQPGDVHANPERDVLRASVGRPERDGHLHPGGDGHDAAGNRQPAARRPACGHRRRGAGVGDRPEPGRTGERPGGRHGPAQRQLHPRPGRGRRLGHGDHRDRLRPGPGSRSSWWRGAPTSST